MRRVGGETLTAAVEDLAELRELVTPPIAKLSLVPGCHPDAGFSLELRKTGAVAAICLACRQSKLLLPIRTAAFQDAAAQATLALLNAAELLRRHTDCRLVAEDLEQHANRLAVELERAQIPIIPSGTAAQAAAHLQVLELVQQHGREAVLTALAAVEGVARG